MSRWSPTIVKFIDLFHLYPWPETIIERPDILRIDTLFPFLTDIVQNIPLFLFSVWFLTSRLGSNLEFYGQDNPNHNKYRAIRFVISELAGKGTLFFCTICLCFFFSIWCRWPHLGQPSWILRSRWSQNIAQNHSIIYVMP